MASGTREAEGMPALAGIVPRWEWRTFGESFEAADVRFSELTAERVQESDEVYLLSLDSDASVKVRDELMDVKQLAHVNDDGLEQWRPVMKSEFPISAAEVGSLLAVLRADAPPLERAGYRLDELLDEVVRASKNLRAVNVHKHRAHYTPKGCMAEVTELRTSAGSTRTIAFESEDPSLVTATVRELG